MNYTKEQSQAISLRGKDILVSAGAGAGKTRVLVDRIVGLILDQEDPMDISELLVLTFTNAAAAEMKERIRVALEEEREKNPGNYHLARQIRKVKNADISTVHSFCGKLLRNYFQELGIDPSFRIGEEGEMRLIRQNVMEQLLEDAYAKEEEDFLNFVEAYFPGKEDKKLEDMIDSLYSFSNNFPDRKHWFAKKQEEAFSYVNAETFYQSSLCQELFARMKKGVDLAMRKLEIAEEYFILEEPQRYFAVWQKDRDLIRGLQEAKDLKELSDRARALSLPSLPRANKAEKEWDYIEEMKMTHGDVKNILAEKILPFCIKDEITLFRENQQQAKYLHVICSLADEFGTKYFEEKQKKNLYDFNDMEHLTLQLLIEQYDEELPVPSDTAKQLQQKYKAVFVDEYQDTNLVQETLIQMIHNQEYNQLFVVGDVKQSIYRFRQARPDLFLNRYEKYGDEASKEGVRIELRDNFRSAPNVLYYTNMIFRQLMHRNFGGIEYSDEVALRPGENGPMAADETISELLLLTEDESREEVDGGADNLEAESFMIGRRIQRLKEEGYQYKDMAILLRSVQEHAPVMAECLTKMGIPCICDIQTGYFDTREVAVIMSYLSVIDNVYQDIPMAAVLRSSIGGLTNTELAELKLLVEKKNRREYYLYELLKLSLEESENDVLKSKVQKFLSLLSYFRTRKKEIPLHELLWEIYQKTGYFYEVMLYPKAEERKENLLMLIQKAQEYEKTVYKGLFYFMRYMEQLKTYEIDLSTSSSQESQEDAVRIMTIHKSKGLEFPVVFVSRIHGRFNQKDVAQSILLHSDLGIGMDYVDLEYRIEHPSFQKKAIKERIKKETLEEELRILYVAMTRAKKKLILTGFVKEDTLSEKVKKYQSEFIPEQAINFLDWIIAALVHHPKSGAHLCEVLNEHYYGGKKEEPYMQHDCTNIKLMRFAELEIEEILDESEKKEPESLEEYLNRTQTSQSDKDQEAIKKSFSHRYAHDKTVEWKRKYSVSELKKLYQQADHLEQELLGSPGEENLFAEEKGTEELQEEPLKPAFLQEQQEEKISAVSRGTIVHKMMELLAFGEIQTKGDLQEALEKIKEQYPPMKKLSAKRLYRYAEGFLFSDIGNKIRQYDREGMVQKELPFTVGLPAQMIYEADGEDEFIVVQGVIDQCVETEEGLWLIDYKTDRIKRGEETVLLDRYRGQMLYYKTALEQILKKRVVKQFIYSFELAQFIEVTG